nr:hypothetical protein [uncultured Roseateles sp.]
MNVHTPERHPAESMTEYRGRRVESRRLVRQATCAGIGNQHKAPSARRKLRDSQRLNGKLKGGTYGAGLLTPQRARNRSRMAVIHQLQDVHGAFTHVGRIRFSTERRVWLAGVSAHRGY